MYPLIQDLRFSLKLMRKRVSMTILVLAALILGMGLNTAIFSVVNAVLLRPLPIFQPDRVVWLHSVVNQTGAQLGTSYPDFLDWKAQSHSFEDMAAMYFFTATLSGYGTPENIKAVAISGSGFKVWGVKTITGRDFGDDDDKPEANRVAVLSHKFWQRKFGGDSAVLGKSLVLNGQQYTIIGVLQPTPISHLNYADVYVTNGPLLRNSPIVGRESRWFFPVGRLKPQIGITHAQTEIETISRRLAEQYPATNKEYGVRLESMTDNLTGRERKPLTLLILASGLIFLLAVVNVTIVFAAATLERAQELSVRLALGAQRSTLFRQFLLQALILAAVGAGFGLLIAKLGIFYFLHRFPNAAVRFQETDIDLRVIAITIAMAFGTTLLASLVPAIYALRANVSAELRRESQLTPKHKYRAVSRGVFLLTEVALASSLSLVAALLIKSLYEVKKVDLGFNPHSIYSFQISPPITRYKEPPKLIALYKEAVNKLAALPGIESVSGISSLPLTGQQLVNALDTDTQSLQPSKPLLVEDESVLPTFFQTMRVPVLQGRDFNDKDRDGIPPVVIVDEFLARKLWPDQNPVGKRLRMSPMIGKSERWLEVVGVVREIKHLGPERPVKWMQVYVPEYQDPSPKLSFVVNTTVDGRAIQNAAENALHALDKDLPVEDFETLDNYLDNNFLAGRRITLILLSAFASITILLGAVGIYGVAANSVSTRRRELAIRLALGATPRQIVILVARLGVTATLGGILVGSVIVISLTRLLASFLYGVSTLNPRLYAYSAILLILLAILAALVPAVRVSRFNIQEILRQ
ncbi:MAG TPA: ABC transporter permease [Candidatus Angelobacter sp.]